ncbi:MAG: queuosine precursor transporter [Myxococcales bacterium]|nr:queuosine precursor transporter [Myxococcales bacterium]MDH3845763.1 queuosine precursor transporter [Myxococcales bacterium]
MKEADLLPSEQHAFDGLPKLDAATLHERRQTVFLVFSGFFLGTLAMLNILGITRFIDLSFQIPGTDLTIPMPLAVGVLPYPITFLCTDFLSELYGRHRANQVVWVGLALNLWVMLILWIGGELPGFELTEAPTEGVFFEVRRLAFGAVTASMIAYLAAQFIDVQLFHFWKQLTDGRHLWLRNNGSTLISQLVDTVAVILITHFFARALPINSAESLWPQLVTFIAAGYTFKLTVALVDTLPFYIGVKHLGRYLRIHPVHGTRG